MKNLVFLLFSMLAILGCENTIPSVENLIDMASLAGTPTVNYSIDHSSPTLQTTINISGSCSDNLALPSNAVKVCVKHGGSCSYPTDFTLTTDCTSGSYSTPIGGALISTEGTYDIKVAVEDSEGNVSSWAGPASYVIDRTSPSKPTSITRLSLTATQGNDSTPTLDIHYSAIDVGDYIYIFTNSSCTGAYVGYANSTVSGTAIVSVDVNSFTMTDGNIYNFYVLSTDAAGNQAPCSGVAPAVSHTYSYDITPPSVVIDTPSLTNISSFDTTTISISYPGAAQSTLTVSDINLVTTGTVACSSSLTQTASYPSVETWQLSLSSCTGDGTIKIGSINAGKSMDVATNVDLGGGSSAIITVDNTPPGAFTISGVTGGSDTTVDADLNTTNFAKISWSASTGALNYDVIVYQNDGTTVMCSIVNTTATFYNFSSCSLTPGSSYKVAVWANKNAFTTSASNNNFTFLVNRAPSITIDTYYMPYNGSGTTIVAPAALPTANDTDPDSHTLTIQSVASGSNGTATLDASGRIVYTPNTNFHGLDSITYTITDGHGGTASGAISIKVVGAGTWIGNGGTALWSNGANWCSGINTTLSGCTQGTAPSAATMVLFDVICSTIAGGSCSSTLSTNMTVLGIDINSTYTGTIDNTSTSFTVGANGFNQFTGTFQSGSGSMMVQGPFKLAGGTFRAPTGSLTVQKDAHILGAATFNHNNGAFLLGGTATTNLTHEFVNTPTFYNFTLTGSTNVHDFGGSVITVNGNLTFNATTTTRVFNNGRIQLFGSLLSGSVGSSGYYGTGLIQFVGTNNQSATVTTSTLFVPSIEIVKTGGVFDFSSSNLTVAGNFTYTSGTVTTGTSTVHFLTQNQNVTLNSGSIAFNNVRFTSNSVGVTRTITGTVTVNGTLDFNSASIISVINGGRIQSTYDVNFLNKGASGSTELEFAGSANPILTVDSTADVLDGTIYVNKAATTVISLYGNMNLDSPGQDLAIVSGDMALMSPPSNLTVNDNLSIATGSSLSKNGNILTYGSLVNNGFIWP